MCSAPGCSTDCMSLGGGARRAGVEVPLPHNGFQPFLAIDWQAGVCAALAVALGAAGHVLARRLARA
jgi:hypothetical protein